MHPANCNTVPQDATRVYLPLYNDTPPRPRQPACRWRIQLLICILLCCGTLICKHCYPTGQEILRTWILGTGEERIQVAVSNFDQALRRGQPVSEAFAVFRDDLTNSSAP